MSTISVWSGRDPFTQFDDAFGTIVRRAFGPTARGGNVTRVSPARSNGGRISPVGFVPAVDAHRDGDDAVVTVELPGVDVNKDVTVTVDGGRLTVRGERRRAHEQTGRGIREVRYGSFARSFSVPEHVGAEDVTASYDSGVLTVRVAGAYASAPAPQEHSIPITVGSAVAGSSAQSPEVAAPDAAAQDGTPAQDGAVAAGAATENGEATNNA